MRPSIDAAAGSLAARNSRFGSSLHGVTSEVDAIPINASTLEGWYLLQGKAGAVSFTTDI
jgi:hypothetical protein